MAYGGGVTVDGHPLLRLLVAPEPHVRTPDVAGVYLLDSASRVLRRSELVVTRLGPRYPFSDVRLTVAYAEVLTGVALRARSELTQVLNGGQRVRGVVVNRAAERTVIASYRFLRAVPAGVPASGALMLPSL